MCFLEHTIGPEHRRDVVRVAGRIIEPLPKVYCKLIAAAPAGAILPLRMARTPRNSTIDAQPSYEAWKGAAGDELKRVHGIEATAIP